MFSLWLMGKSWFSTVTQTSGRFFCAGHFCSSSFWTSLNLHGTKLSAVLEIWLSPNKPPPGFYFWEAEDLLSSALCHSHQSSSVNCRRTSVRERMTALKCQPYQWSCQRGGNKKVEMKQDSLLTSVLSFKQCSFFGAWGPHNCSLRVTFVFHTCKSNVIGGWHVNETPLMFNLSTKQLDFSARWVKTGIKEGKILMHKWK